MAVLKWHEPEQKFYEAGVDRGVIYISQNEAVAWSGLISVNEEPDVNSEVRYFDGIGYHARKSTLPIGGTIEAYSYPEEFEPFAGYLNVATGQKKPPFNFSYRTLKGTQVSEGYKIHILYNVIVFPAEGDYDSIDMDPTLTTLSWEFASAHVIMPHASPSSELIIDSTIAHPWTVQAVEDILYGTDSADARCPTPQEVYDTVEENAILQIIDHGDGTWSAIGPDDAISMIDSTTFSIDWPSAVYIDDVTYKISSL